MTFTIEGSRQGWIELFRKHNPKEVPQVSPQAPPETPIVPIDPNVASYAIGELRRRQRGTEAKPASTPDKK